MGTRAANALPARLCIRVRISQYFSCRRVRGIPQFGWLLGKASCRNSAKRAGDRAPPRQQDWRLEWALSRRCL